ncbi:hypothetical protein DPX16_3513 [Anabarilius grahami]|uniref:C2H2-type domain-containing protein n=1 Tax=Anabarilius grahami TaxID=495550 RepID=A0A3N0Y6R5_ANAGA|nr:hypothetical protein DPX16_3513 [Anabarilius grahami]
MAFIKEENEDIKIEEAFSVKQEDTETQTKMAFIKESENVKIEETFRVKQEDTETQTKMVFIKESENVKIEETFRVKQEDTETQTKMVFIKEKSENVKIEETFRVKQEDTEEQTDKKPEGGRKRKTIFEVAEKRRKLSEERNQTRVVLGQSFQRWRAMKEQKGVKTDAQFAKILLDRDADFSMGGIEKLSSSSSSDLMLLKEETEVLDEMEEDQDEKYHDFTTGEKFSCSETENSSSRKTETIRYFNCLQCGQSFTKKANLKVHMSVHTECPNTENLLVKRLRPTIIKMAFIKEESEDMKIEETFRVKQEDTEEQTDCKDFRLPQEDLNGKIFTFS